MRKIYWARKNLSRQFLSRYSLVAFSQTPISTMTDASYSTASAAYSSYSSKDTTLTYVDQSDQISAASMTIRRTANLANVSKEGAANGQENINLPTYSQALEDPNNGNTIVHKVKFDPNAQGTNDQIYTSINDVPGYLRGMGGFNSGLTTAPANPTVFATPTLSQAVASSSVADVSNTNATTMTYHPVTHTTDSTVASGPAAAGTQGSTTVPPTGTNGNHTYSLTL